MVSTGGIRQRLPGVFALAIVGLFAGSMAGCGSAVSVAWPFVEPVIDRVLDEEEDTTATGFAGKTWMEIGEWGLSVLDLIVCVLLLVACIGLLRLRPWARKLGLACGVLVLVLSLKDFFLSCWNWSESIFSGEDVAKLPTGWKLGLGVTDLFANMTGLFLAIVWLSFGVALILVLRRPAVAAAFYSRRREAT